MPSSRLPRCHPMHDRARQPFGRHATTRWSLATQAHHGYGTSAASHDADAVMHWSVTPRIVCTSTRLIPVITPPAIPGVLRASPSGRRGRRLRSVQTIPTTLPSSHGSNASWCRCGCTLSYRHDECQADAGECRDAAALATHRIINKSSTFTVDGRIWRVQDVLLGRVCQARRGKKCRAAFANG